MLKVGLTGNMGSGKSTVSEIFRILNIPVYHADEAAKNMYLKEEIKARVVALAGEQILDKTRQIDRKALADAIFSDPAMLHNLTQLIHPLVREDFILWCMHHTGIPYVIHEAAILFESGYSNEYDAVIHVSCPEEIALERIRQRDHLPAEKIRERIRFQMSDHEKASRSDFVITNDGLTLVIPQVLAIHEKLLQRSPDSNDEVPAGRADP